MPETEAASKTRQQPPPKKRLIDQLRETIRFANAEPRSDFTRLQRVLFTYIRVVLLVFRLDVYRRVEQQAQALTMQSLLAIVPLLAVCFALFKALGGMETIEPRIQTWIVENLSGSSEMLRERLAVLVTGLKDAKIGALSIIILAWTAISLLGSIESSINSLFGVTATRATGTRLLIYWAIVTLGPILLVASFALTASLEAGGWHERLGVLARAFVVAAPLAITVLAFATLYFVVPATPIRPGAALTAALVAGSLFHAAKWGFAWYARTNVNVHDLYGSLAALPMFILLVYVSWLLVLFGAQLCFAFQNASTYRREDAHAAATHSALERAVCRIFLEVARDFYYGHAPTRPDRAGALLKMPGYLVERSLELLKLGGFVRLTADGFVPGVDLERVTVHDLLAHLRRGIGAQPQAFVDEPRLFLDGLLDSIDQHVERIGGAVTFRELAMRFPPASAT